MKYKFCNIRINLTKYEVRFATRGVGLLPTVATPLVMTVPYSNSRLS